MSRPESAGPLRPVVPISRDTTQSSVELLRSLRRISRAVSSNLDLESVLQAVVDAVCDHTQWQACWINEVNMTQNAAEVVARRDKLAFTTASRKPRWDLHVSPSLEALRLDAPIAMPDISQFPHYVDYCEDAHLRGAIAGAVIPFPSLDPTDRPRTLSVQSTIPLLSDDRQLPFLRTVTAMAALAVQHARQLEASRRELLQATESLALFSFATESLARGESMAWIVEQLEERTESALLLFDDRGGLVHVGRSPARYQTSDADWERTVRVAAGELADRVVAHYAGTAISAPLQVDGVLPVPATHRVIATRLPGTPALGALVAVGRADAASPVHHALGPAVGAAVIRDRVRAQVERDLGADVLSALFAEGPRDDVALARQADAFGIDVGCSQVLVVLRDEEGSSPRLRLAAAAAVQPWKGATVHVFGGAVVAFVPVDSDKTARSRVDALHRALTGGAGPRLQVAWAGPCRARGEYPAAWRECTAALDLARKLGRREPVTLAEFGSYRFLLAALGERDIGEHIDRTLGPVLEHDRQHGGGLLDTVEAFLACGGRLQETARRLHIHVSTLRYRLERIRALMCVDLNDDNARFDISLAVRLHRMRLLQQSTG